MTILHGILYALLLIGAGLSTALAVTIALHHSRVRGTASIFALIFGLFAAFAAWRLGVWIDWMWG